MKRLLLPLLAAQILINISPIFASHKKGHFVDRSKQGYEVKTDPLTDLTEIGFWLYSEDKVEMKYGRDKPTYIRIDCDKKDTNIYIVTPTYNHRDYPVFIRWDKNDLKKYWKDQTSDTKAFYVGDDKDQRKFLSKVDQHDSLVFGWYPYDKARRTSKFDLKKLTQLKEWAKEDGCKF